MLENRSFDHIFGFAGISGVDALTGLPTNLEGLVGDEANTADGVRYQVSQDAPFAMHEDPGHGFLDVVEQLAGPGSPYPAGHGGHPDTDMPRFATTSSTHPLPGA